MSTAGSREHLRWIVRETGPESSEHTVLLLPGALASAVFYDDLLAEPTIAQARIRFVVTTLPGFGRTPALQDLSVKGYARSAGALAADLGCDAVVGHSLGANVAIEMVAAGEFSGPSSCSHQASRAKTSRGFRGPLIVSHVYSGTSRTRSC